MLRTRGLGVCLNGVWELRGVDFDLEPDATVALLGAGARAFAGALGRTLELEHEVIAEGAIEAEDEALHACDGEAARRRLPTVFGDTPLPGSILANMTLALGASARKSMARARCEEALRRVGLWDAIREKLGTPAGALDRASRVALSLARAYALRPLAVIVDLPKVSRVQLHAVAGVPPVATLFVREEVDAVARACDRIAFFGEGTLLEEGPTRRLLTHPGTPALERFLAGKETGLSAQRVSAQRVPAKEQGGS